MTLDPTLRSKQSAPISSVTLQRIAYGRFEDRQAQGRACRSQEAVSSEKRSKQSAVYKLLIALLACLLHTHAFAATEDTYTFRSQADSERFHALTDTIRCVVCQNQTIADSNAPLANDLREKVYRMVNEGKSDIEITQYLVKRYGEFILLKPRFHLSTLFLWLFPFLGLLVTTWLFWRFMPKQN